MVASASIGMVLSAGVVNEVMSTSVAPSATAIATRYDLASAADTTTRIATPSAIDIHGHPGAVGVV